MAVQTRRERGPAREQLPSPASAGGVRSHLKATGDKKRQESGCAKPACGATGWLPSSLAVETGCFAGTAIFNVRSSVFP